MHSTDQAAIVIDWASVTSTATEVPGKNCRSAKWLRFLRVLAKLFPSADRVPISGLPMIWRLSF